jgi:hypothetical protein
MMTLKQLLRENKDAIVARWLDDVLATYPEPSSGILSRRSDRFANPVGHSLRAGTESMFESLFEESEPASANPHLQEIVRIRAIQQFSASEAVGFVFRLRAAIQAVLGETLGDRRLTSDWQECEDRINRLALAAFDHFVRCRERVYELRVNELKRQIPWAVRRMNGRAAAPEPQQTPVELSREGVRL